LDAERLHSIAVVETDDGYIVRASHPDHRRPLLIEAPHTQPPATALPAPMARASVAEGMPLLCRSGYANALYALGCRLDRQHATSITISEGEHFVAVCLRPADAAAPREELFLADDLTQLLAQAQHAHAPLRLRAEQAAWPETATQQSAGSAGSARRTAAQRRPGDTPIRQLHRLAAHLMSGVRQQPGG
jgi:hypothetical protein